MGFIRRAIIFIAQLVALLFIVISTVGGYTAGMQGPAYAGVRADPALFGLVGALSGFFFSLMVTAAFFALVEIAHNTRKI
jgi:uncharacterized BrkB/YihY/UPF0761 family membrane protein